MPFLKCIECKEALDDETVLKCLYCDNFVNATPDCSGLSKTEIKSLNSKKKKMLFACDKCAENPTSSDLY